MRLDIDSDDDETPWTFGEEEPYEDLLGFGIWVRARSNMRNALGLESSRSTPAAAEPKAMVGGAITPTPHTMFFNKPEVSPGVAPPAASALPTQAALPTAGALPTEPTQAAALPTEPPAAPAQAVALPLGPQLCPLSLQLHQPQQQHHQHPDRCPVLWMRWQRQQRLQHSPPVSHIELNTCSS